MKKNKYKNKETEYQVPVFIAAISPFFLLTFDENDDPDFTLDEVT